MLLLAPIVIFLPGFSWVLCSGLNKRFGALETIALSLIISITFDSLFTAALSMLGFQYLPDSVTGALVISLILLLVWALRHRHSPRLTLRLGFDHKMMPLVITAGAYAVMLLLLGWSTPIYPSTDALDPVTHAQIVESIIGGSGKTLLLHTSFPIGLHFASAFVGTLLDVNGLSAMRILLGIALIDSILLTYFCARTLLGEVAAGYTILVTGFVIPVDAIHFIRVGTFPNMLSDVIVLAVLWLIFAFTRQPNRAMGLTLTFLAVGGLFVHSTFILFLASLWVALPIFLFCNRFYLRNYVKALLFTTGGLLLLAVLLGSFLLSNVARVLFGSYGTGSAAPSTPILLALQVIVWNYRAFAGSLAPLLILVAVTFSYVNRRNSMGLTFIYVWLGVLVTAMVASTESWRFILLSLTPASFLIGSLLSMLSRLPDKLRARGNMLKALRLGAPLLLIVLVLSGSFIPLLPRIYNPADRLGQQTIFDSMSWLRQNSKNSGVVSVGLSTSYRYLELLTGITYIGDYDENATSIVSRSTYMGFRYVAVATQSSQFPTFEFSSKVQEKYRNSIVAIFFIP